MSGDTISNQTIHCSSTDSFSNVVFKRTNSSASLKQDVECVIKYVHASEGIFVAIDESEGIIV